MHSIHSISRSVFVLLAILSSNKPAGCNPITNSNLNDHIRDFSVKDDINSTRIKTLQKEEPGRYASFAPVHPVRFKDASDSSSSSSSYSRGLLHHEQPGYTIHDYEDSPHISYGYEYVQDTDHGHHGFDHHHLPDHYYGHHGGHHHINYHHKHYDHALAAKTIFWPIAGIALLGAAAALVSNPVLLQLGVVSGKRKRRETLERDTELEWLKKIYDKDGENIKTVKKLTKKHVKKSSTKHFHGKELDYSDLNKNLLEKVHLNMSRGVPFKEDHRSVEPSVEDVLIAPDLEVRKVITREKNENAFLPVPLIIKKKL